MPLLRISTNTHCDDHAALLQQASAAVAEMLGKPENYVMVEINDKLSMCFAGTSEPLAYLELKSIGLPESRTAEFSNTLCTLLGPVLGVAAERIYIEFADAPRKLWGWNGGTF